MKSKSKPWIEGPLELLEHSIGHLELDSAFDTRIAMISVDSSIELMIKTFLGLPRRVSGIKGPSKNKLRELSDSFPSLLDAVEEFSPDKVGNIDLADIEWFHHIRNQLYHDGNGITVEKQKVETYLEIAKNLFSQLFEVPIDDLIEIKSPNSIEEFFIKWRELDNELIRLGEKLGIGSTTIQPKYLVIRRLVSRKVVEPDMISEIKLLRNFRNELIHGKDLPPKTELVKWISFMTKVLKLLQAI